MNRLTKEHRKKLEKEIKNIAKLVDRHLSALGLKDVQVSTLKFDLKAEKPCRQCPPGQDAVWVFRNGRRTCECQGSGLRII